MKTFLYSHALSPLWKRGARGDFSIKFLITISLSVVSNYRSKPSKAKPVVYISMNYFWASPYQIPVSMAMEIVTMAKKGVNQRLTH